jgi:selenocysteine lyase/cysteine desulfurase
MHGIDCEALVRSLAAEGLFVSHGNFYAETAVARLGVPEVVRVGCACYSTEDDVLRLVEAVRKSNALSKSDRRAQSAVAGKS